MGEKDIMNSISINQILKVLKTERVCIKRQGTNKCNRRCGECDLCLEDAEILEVYDFLIEAFTETLQEGDNK